MYEQPKDFLDESEALHALLAPLVDADFKRVTRFKGWTINDVLTHLHFWNRAVDIALTDEPAFVALAGDLISALATEPLRAYENRAIALEGRALLAAWRDQYRVVAERFASVDPKARVKWVGPDMSARSSVTARLMETWAHGQEVYDSLGVARIDGDRIRNIAVLGLNTFGWTFKVHGLPVPAVVPHVRLVAPSGEVWALNDARDDERIEGSATEFCQVVTQVRNIADTRLRLTGDVARQWMAIAQCFAGGRESPPAPGTRYREGSR